MSVSRTKTWAAGEVLTASDLNTEFNNIISNGQDLGSPRTKALDMDGQQITLDADSDSYLVEDSDDVIKMGLQGVDLFYFDGDVASPVNGLTFTASATGTAVSIDAQGSDANIDIALTPKGTGIVTIPGDLAHAGDTDNKIALTTDAQSFETGGSSRLDISDSGVRLGGANARVTTVLDEDTMSSDSATSLATQQSIKAYVDTTVQSQEEVEDIAGAMFTGNTETFITATYQDADGTIDLVVPVKDEDDMASDSATDLATQQSIKAYVDGLSTLETSVDATNGGANDLTEIDFTGISANAVRITVMFSDVSLSGSDDFLVQIGDSGGVETTGYVSRSADEGGSGVSSSTSGFVVRNNNAAHDHIGKLVMDRINGNEWVATHLIGGSSAGVYSGFGNKSLSETLDRVRITRAGTNTFDGGNVNIHVEVER